MTRKHSWTALAGAALLALAATPAFAQDDAEMPMDGMTVAVTGIEYAFTGLPESVPVGTTLTFTNGGVELHEMVVNRIADGVEETFEELMALNESGVDLEAEGYIDTGYGGQMLLALPGQTAEETITLDQEGRYVVLCYVPTGLEPAKLEEFGVDITTLDEDTDMAELPAEAQAYLQEVMTTGVPHLVNGMIQEFTVTAAEGDTEAEA
jgi:plastocyanin